MISVLNKAAVVTFILIGSQTNPKSIAPVWSQLVEGCSPLHFNQNLEAFITLLYPRKQYGASKRFQSVSETWCLIETFLQCTAVCVTIGKHFPISHGGVPEFYFMNSFPWQDVVQVAGQVNISANLGPNAYDCKKTFIARNFLK